MAHERIASADIAKGIAILAIVVGHMVFTDTAGNDVLHPWLYEFHVPIFFIIAGYFLSTKHALPSFIVGKAVRLLLPYALTALLIIACTWVFGFAGSDDAWPSSFACAGDALASALYGSGSWYNASFLGAAPIGPIWFLLTLFSALLIVQLCLRFKHGLVLTVPIAVAALATARLFWLPWNLQSAGVASLLMAIGCLLRRRDFLSKPVNPLTFFLCACVALVAGVYNLNISFASLLTEGSIGFSLLTAIAASLLVLMLSQLVAEHAKPVGTVLGWFGRSSLVILCIHTLLLSLGLLKVLALTGLAGNALAAAHLAAQLAICSGCVALFKRVPGVRKVFY